MSAVMISLNGPSVFDDMPSETYHADPAPEPSLSSGIAKLLVTASPLHAWHSHPRLNPAYEEEEDGIFDRGSAAHALLLQGDDLMVECAFDDWRKKEAREMRGAIRAAGKLPLLSKHVAGVRRMVEVAKKALLESELHATIEDFHAERTVIWRDEILVGTTNTIQPTSAWKRARFDLQHRTRPLLLDYKTAENADPFAFQRAIVPLGYDIQAAHYCEAHMAMEHDVEPDFIFLVQEREPPFACSLVGLEPSFLDLGQRKTKHATKIWAECLKHNDWSGYSHRIAWAAPPGWALTDFELRLP